MPRLWLMNWKANEGGLICALIVQDNEPLTLIIESGFITLQPFALLNIHLPLRPS